MVATTSLAYETHKNEAAYGEFAKQMTKEVVAACEEEEGYPEGGIAPGTKWEDVPEDFECPLCSVGKDQFSEV